MTLSPMARSTRDRCASGPAARLTVPLQYRTCFEVVAVGALHTVHVQWQDTTTVRSGAVTFSLVFHDGGRLPARVG
jgi:hypothetical protein